MTTSKDTSKAPAPQSFDIDDMINELLAKLSTEPESKDPVLGYPNHFNPKCFK
jgi:hypothetical protein